MLKSKIGLLTLLIALCGCKTAKTAEEKLPTFSTQEELITEIFFAQADQDLRRYLNTMHPACKKYFTKERIEIFKSSLKLDKLVKDEFKIRKIVPSKLATHSHLFYATQPTESINVIGDFSKESSFSLIYDLAKYNDSWYYVPSLTKDKFLEETLKKARVTKEDNLIDATKIAAYTCEFQVVDSETGVGLDAKIVPGEIKFRKYLKIKSGSKATPFMVYKSKNGYYKVIWVNLKNENTPLTIEKNGYKPHLVEENFIRSIAVEGFERINGTESKVIKLQKIK